MRELPGSPDIVFTRWRLAVFVDGVWWHGHPDWLPAGRRGPYWDQKIARNRERDGRVDETLSLLGWRVLRIWDKDVLSDPDAAAGRVGAALAEQRRPPSPSV
jgi:DNA mismatch endonuclease (patch repair protein)